MYICIHFVAQSSQNQNKIGDDQTNWAEMWNVLSQSNNGRSAVADSRRPSLFDIILKANAAARRRFHCNFYLYGIITYRC